MAFLFHKFQEAIKVLAKNPMLARDPRHLQFEADINRLFLYTSFNRLGKNADENDAEEIIDVASKASVKDQQKQVQENIHYQLKNICMAMDKILLPDQKAIASSSSDQDLENQGIRQSGLTFSIGKGVSSANQPVVPNTKPMTRLELSERLKDHIGYTLDIRPSEIPHEKAGQGLFIRGEAEVGSIVAFYPGVIYSPAYYRNIPGYPRVDAFNTYLITRYDGIVINGQPWGTGGEDREAWDGCYYPDYNPSAEEAVSRSDRIWRMLTKPVENNPRINKRVVLERRNPLALGHFANHPPKETTPNVIISPYDFPLTETDMRTYVPNLVFGNEERVSMKRFGTFWFKSGGFGSQGVDSDTPVIKTLVLVATRALKDEEILLNYRLSNQKKRPDWYTPVDEDEDRRRWS